MSSLQYVIISPLKDEEAYVEATLRSVVDQEVKPARWVIVDDGSSDKSPEIVERYCREHAWITLLRSERKGERQPGSPVIHAFNRGYRLIENDGYDIVVKLDCDLLFDPGYFKSILEHFEKDDLLGIASGIYLEENGSGWAPIEMPWYHTAGACKVMRANCFREIGGFVAARGWDTVDEIRAQYRGWSTRHFTDLKMHHLKKEGSGIGSLRTGVMHGEVFYRTGGSKTFFIFKVLHRMIFGQPLVIGGMAVLWGYLHSLMRNTDLLVTEEEGRFYRRQLNSRMLDALRAKNN